MHESNRLRVRIFALLALAVVAAAPTRIAGAVNKKSVDKVTDLNRKALEAYAISDFEKAKKLLKQALDICAAEGLDGHPIKARTHIHMGVVMVGGLRQHELGVKQFQKALEIQPDIKVTRNVATADVQAAFEEASSAAPPPKKRSLATADDGGDGDGGDGGDGKRAKAADVAQPDEITHTPISRGKRGGSIAVMVNVGAEVEGVDKVILIYRPEDSDDFFEKPMTKSGSRYGAEIPASATKGNKVAYYVEARGEDDSVVKAVGSESRPFMVALAKGSASKCDEDDEDCQEGGGDDGRPFRKLYFAVMGGSGAGYTTGADELNSDNKVNPAGFAPSSLIQIAPEVGYFVSPNLRLSLQVRVQMVSGLTQVNLDSVAMTRPGINVDKCGADHLCPPASGAVAAFLRASWFFGTGAFRPYATAAVGGGQIRHVVAFDKKVCGMSGTQGCVGTVLSGPAFVGPGAGFIYGFSEALGLVVDVGTVLGFPSFTFHIDFNAGLALRI